MKGPLPITVRVLEAEDLLCVCQVPECAYVLDLKAAVLAQTGLRECEQELALGSNALKDTELLSASLKRFASELGELGMGEGELVLDLVDIQLARLRVGDARRGEQEVEDQVEEQFDLSPQLIDFDALDDLDMLGPPSMPDSLVTPDPLEEVIAVKAGFRNFQEPLSAQELRLDSTGLEALPPSLGRITELRTLSLADNKFTCLPEAQCREEVCLKAMERLEALQRLDLHGNQLEALPQALGRLTSLEEMDASENRLVKLPAGLCKLWALRALNLRDNALDALLEDFGKLRCLEVLDAGDNRLVALPDSFCALTGLRSLKLDGNELAQLPEAFQQLQALQELDLSGNMLQELPSDFGSLTSLTRLDLSRNWLTRLPPSFSALAALCRAAVAGNRLVELPSDVGHLQSLESLDASQNQLESLPQSFPELLMLASLDLRENPLTSRPQRLKAHSLWLGLSLMHHLGSLTSAALFQGQTGAVPTFLTLKEQMVLERYKLQSLPSLLCACDKLTTLRLAENSLHALPDAFGNLQQLRSLDVSKNLLEALPASFGRLVQLEVLSAGSNRLTGLPESFCTLRSLSKAELSQNLLEDLPDNIARLCALTSLGLTGNQLSSLPSGFGGLSVLAELELGSNPLAELPGSFGDLKSLVSLGLQATPLSFSLEHSEGLWEQALLWRMTQWGGLHKLLLWSRQEGGVPAAVDKWRWCAIPPGTSPPGSPRAERPGQVPPRGPPPAPEPEPRPKKNPQPMPRPRSHQNDWQPFWEKEALLMGVSPEMAIAALKERLDALEGSDKERQRLLRQLFLEWHPDKRPGEERTATQVFQWLQSVK